MKLNLILLFFLCCLLSPLSAQKKLVFSYDAAGNQILRNLVSTSSTATVPDNDLVSNLTVKLPEGMNLRDTGFKLSAYPNPTVANLMVEWDGDSYPTSITLSSIDGRLLGTFILAPRQRQQHIELLSYPTGTYLLNVAYPDNSTKKLKVIKN